MSKKTTLKDIAEAVGLSIASVSLVLNGRPCRLSKENKRKIKQVAHRLNYVPNQTARNLVTQRSDTLGLIIPDIENPFFASLAKSFEKYCRLHDYGLLLSSTQGSDTSDIDLSKMFVQHGVAGLAVVVSDDLFISDTQAAQIQGLPVPLVLLDRAPSQISCDKVFTDNEEGGYLAAKHLIDLGHRHIAGVFNTKTSLNGKRRLEGFRKAFDACGMSFDPSLIFECSYDIQEAYEIGHEIVSTDATAVFLTSDPMALGVLKSFAHEHISVPGDISCIGYDNALANLLFTPKLTVIDQKTDIMALRAFEVLDSRIRRKSGPYTVEKLQPQLIAGQSCRSLLEQI